MPLVGSAALFGHKMRGHEGIACARDAGDKDMWRLAFDHAVTLAAFGSGFAAVCDQNPTRAAIKQGRGGLDSGRVFGPGKDVGFFTVDVKRGRGMRDQRQQAFGLARRGGGHAQIGGGEQRRCRDIRQRPSVG